MTLYRAPLREFRFVLDELLQVESFSSLPRFKEITPDLIEAILIEGARLAENKIHPINQAGDEEGCRLEDGKVLTPKGFKEAYAAFVNGGWGGLSGESDYGGQGLPYVVAATVSEMMGSANLAFSTYTGLAEGAARALSLHGTDEQKRLFLPRLTSAEWGGTMELTEPQCGTDLGLVRTKAEPRAEGGYTISGTKIFITGGEHNLTENIIHLVLGRIVGAPPGIKGLSLFIVPKYLVKSDGSLGAHNRISCSALEQKMGIRASATCVMNYDKAIGYLAGEPHKGMRAMFTMMNAARLNVGLHGLSLSEIAYQNAAAYAKDRRQGRALSGTSDPEHPADTIISHPDIRRMLLNMKAFNEGARALALWIAFKADIAEVHPNEDVRRDASDLVSLMTPVIKAYFTNTGFDSVNFGLQCFGGHGYIRETGMEQFVRDARITQIYEGANGIQGLDLALRKLPLHFGRNLRQFFHPVDSFIRGNSSEKTMAEFIAPLAKSFARLQQATAWMAEQGLNDAEQSGAGASDYLQLFGLVALAYMWAQSAQVAHGRLNDAPDDEEAYYVGKLNTARFFMGRMLPETSSLLSKITSGKQNLMELEADAF